MNRRKSLAVINDNLYYYSSEDSEDELDRLGAKSRLNTIQSNFTLALGDSPIIIKNRTPNFDRNEFTYPFINNNRSPLKRTRSEVNVFTFSEHRPKKAQNMLKIFNFYYNDRRKYMHTNEDNILYKSKKIYKGHQEVNWQLFYEIIFKDKYENEKENIFQKTNSVMSDLFSHRTIVNDEDKNNKFENNVENYRFKIILNKIKFRLKKKYEYNKDFVFNNDKKHKIKKFNKQPEILSIIKENDNDLSNIYRVGISEIDKNRFIPMFINKLKKKFNILLDERKYAKVKILQSFRKSTFDYDYSQIEKKLKKKGDKSKKIKFNLNNSTNKKFKSKYSITEENIKILKSNLNDHNTNVKRKTSVKNVNIFEEQNNIKLINTKPTILFKNKRSNSIKKKNEFNFLKKNKRLSHLNIGTNYITFKENELRNLNKKKLYLTDDKMELFKNNAKTLINDEILFKELNREYPDYEEELFNLYNNFLLYEKVYDKLEIKNLINLKRHQNFNHNINNFLSLKNKINIPITEKYEINNRIIDSAINLQKIINYLK